MEALTHVPNCYGFLEERNLFSLKFLKDDSLIDLLSQVNEGIVKKIKSFLQLWTTILWIS